MVNLVIVSHSARLGEGVGELARQMLMNDGCKLAIAAGIDDPASSIGTDPIKVMEAIESVADADHVLVMMDIGSALLSAETALDLLDPAIAAKVRLCAAPLVEGTLAATVSAAAGADIDKVIEVGQDPRRFAEDLLRRLRDLIIVAAVPDALTSGLVDVLAEALRQLHPAPDLALVFGSLARGEENARSDVDLLLIADCGFGDTIKALHPAQAVLQREINPVLYTAVEFARRIEAGDGFTLNILASPKLFVIGTADDLGKFAGDPSPASV